MQLEKEKWWSMVYCTGTFMLFALVLIIPDTRAVFKRLSITHPYGMGFAKFALLATTGELLAYRISHKVWGSPCKIVARFVIWGVTGVWITYMMKIFSTGTAALLGGALRQESRLVQAFVTSATMNMCFGPTFMAAHKCSDCWLELRTNKLDSSLACVVAGVDWPAFVRVTLLKTVPLFWIPAHTVTFLLPAEYQVMMAAALSVALGVFLSWKK